MVECFINYAAVKATLSIAIPHIAINKQSGVFTNKVALRDESSQTNVILQLVQF